MHTAAGSDKSDVQQRGSKLDQIGSGSTEHPRGRL